MTFKHPFRLQGASGIWPAGTYQIETDEEDLDSLSVRGQRRLRTIIYRNDLHRGTSEALEIDPDAFRAALEIDDMPIQAAPEIGPPIAPASRPANVPGTPILQGPPERRFTPLWVVPLVLSILIMLGAIFGPFDIPRTPTG